MVWTRSDDREVYDRKIGELTDREYRERDALIAYLAREHPDTGFFHENEHKHAGYASPNGTKSVRKTTIHRLQTLGLVRTADSYSDEELDSLRLTRPNGDKWLRCTNWERYNPPRDRTNAERQARYRNALRNGEVTDPETLRNSPSRAGAARVPVPSLSTSNSQPGLDAPRERVDEEEQARHTAWATRAQAPDVRSPQAFIAAGMRTGGWPDPAPTEQRPVTVNGSAPDDVGCPSCGVGGGGHAADCEEGDDRVDWTETRREIDALVDDAKKALALDDNRTEGRNP